MTIPTQLKTTIESSHNNFVAELRNINLSNASRPKFVNYLKTIISSYGVVVFRNQSLKPRDFSNFARQLGTVHSSPVVPVPFANYPEIKILSNVKKNGKYIGHNNAGHYWHTDRIYLERVIKTSILYGLKCPSTGGDTLFSDTQSAYTDLPFKLRKDIDGKFQIHDFSLAYSRLYQKKDSKTMKQINVKPAVRHPLVVTNPDTMMKSVYMSLVSTEKIESLDKALSIKILEQIEKFCTQDRYVYRHKWEKGDVVVWNNLRSMHKATQFDPFQDRILYKIELQNENSLA